MELLSSCKNGYDMLLKSNISHVMIYTDEWDKVRTGRFTSSKISALLGDKPFTSGALSYIDQKVGEELTGICVSAEEQIDDENTEWGKEYEPMAIRRFSKIMGIEYLVTQRVIFNPDRRFSSTPDGIWVHNESLNKLEYNVSTLEVKCPRKFTRYNPLFRCKTPHDVRRYSASYFWQTIDQMDNCDSAEGYFAAFHPLYPEGSNMRIIKFEKMNLWEEFRLLKQRKKLAEEKFNEFILEFRGT
jgi:hypothetical protein